MQKNPLLEFDPEIESTFHKLKRQRALLTNLQWQKEKKHRGRLFGITLLQVPIAQPRALQYPCCRQQFWAQASAYFYGLAIPVWRLTDGGSQLAPLVFLEGCNTLKINGAFTNVFAYTHSHFHLGPRQGCGHIFFLWGRSRRGMNSPKLSSPSSSHRARRRFCEIR